jgi:hypothetical protein
MPPGVLRQAFPARVVVSLAVAGALVGMIVVAGVLFRDRHPARPTPTMSTAPTTTPPRRGATP